jgi:hypothetical protein
MLSVDGERRELPHFPCSYKPMGKNDLPNWEMCFSSKLLYSNENMRQILI